MKHLEDYKLFESILNYTNYIWFIDGKKLFLIEDDLFNDDDGDEEKEEFINGSDGNEMNNVWFDQYGVETKGSFSYVEIDNYNKIKLKNTKKYK